MNDPRRQERFGSPLVGSGSTEPAGPRTAPLTDPAYADETAYGATYGEPISQWSTGPGLNETSQTRQLPPYWQQDQLPPDQASRDELSPPPPEGPKTPRWLWIAAGAAVLLVVGLLIALVLANGAIKTQTAVPPLPAMPGATSTAPTPSTRTSPPSATAAPVPPGGTEPPIETTEPGVVQDVVYNVNGEGRAISIMYMDTGGVIQTEFNVALPWSKQVSLPKSAVHPASVTIVNIGHNVTCSVMVGGVQATQREGVGLTICDAKTS